MPTHQPHHLTSTGHKSESLRWGQKAFALIRHFTAGCGWGVPRSGKNRCKLVSAPAAGWSSLPLARVFKYVLPFFIQKTVKQDFPRTFGWNFDGICYSNLNSTNDPIRWLFVCPSGLPDWDHCPSCRSHSESVFRCRKWRMRPVKIIMGFCTSQCSMILRVCYLSICLVLFYCPQKAWSIWDKCQQCHPWNPLSAEPRPCVSAFDHTNWWVPFPKAAPEYLFELDSVQYFDHKLYVQICENHSGNLWISELIFLGQRAFGNLLHQSSKKNLVPLYFCAGLSVVDDTKVNLRKEKAL